MIDLKFLRENPDVVRKSQRTRGEDPALVDELIAADACRRESIVAADQARSEQKAFSKEMGQKMREASDEEKQTLRAEGKAKADAVKELEAEQTAAAQAVHDLQMKLSNIVEDGAPAGGEEDFVVLEHVGEPTEFDFEPKDHLELGESLGLIDMKRGTKAVSYTHLRAHETTE